MKKLLAMIIALCLVTGMAAQDEQGAKGDSHTMWLGGKVTFGSMSNRDVTIGPGFGVMLGEKIGIGTSVLFSIGNDGYSWGLEPYFRFYIPVVDQFSFYGDAFMGIGGGDNNTALDGGYYSTFDFGARAGLQYWFTPRWSVAASTNIVTYSRNNGSGEFGAGVSFNSVIFSLFFHF